MDRAKLDELRRRQPEWRDWGFNVAAVCLETEERDALFAYIDRLERAIRDMDAAVGEHEGVYVSGWMYREEQRDSRALVERLTKPD